MKVKTKRNIPKDIHEKQEQADNSLYSVKVLHFANYFLVKTNTSKEQKSY